MTDDASSTVAERPEDAAPATPGAPRTVLTLRFDNGALGGQTFEFPEPRRITLGRAKDCDIEVFDSRCSRVHCSINFDGAAAHLKDLGSANGTLLNGKNVKIAALKSGDLVGLGDTRVRVVFGQEDRTVKLRAVDFASAKETGRILRNPELRLDVPGYTLEGVLGEGATSAVFKARTSSGQVVAIKVLRLSDSISEEDKERFLREAITAAGLEHPNIVQVLERGEANGRLFLVMEYVRGETVKAMLARLGALAVPVTLHIARQIATALEHARQQSIVHRDVKPDNIIVTEDGVAKLVDFGLAKSLQTAGFSGVTRSGDVVGTLAYMSPEQLDSSATADHRSDIYSLGATLYHMIAGETPFQGLVTMDYFKKILYEEPPILGLLRRDVPPIVSAVVAKCMRKRASDRYETAGEVARIVSGLLASGEERNTVF